MSFAYAVVCVPTVYGGHSVPSACGDVCSPVCWRSGSVRWPPRLLQRCPPLYQWCGYYSGYCREGEAQVRELRSQGEWKEREETWQEKTRGGQSQQEVEHLRQYRKKYTWFISNFSIWTKYDFLTSTCNSLFLLCLQHVWLTSSSVEATFWRSRSPQAQWIHCYSSAWKQEKRRGGQRREERTRVMLSLYHTRRSAL